ncbi:MAG: hypothetical protein ACPHK8_07480, partial [Thermoplasmatota archaeon]
MQEDGASAVVGSSMILFITVAGIGLALAVGVPLLSEVQGYAMAKGVSEDFIGAAKDIEGGSGELDIPISKGQCPPVKLLQSLVTTCMYSHVLSKSQDLEVGP